MYASLPLVKITLPAPLTFFLLRASYKQRYPSFMITWGGVANTSLADHGYHHSLAAWLQIIIPPLSSSLKDLTCLVSHSLQESL